MNKSSLCLDKQFLRSFQNEKNIIIREVRKAAYDTLEAAKLLHEGAAFEAVREFSQLYLEAAELRQHHHAIQLDVDRVLEQTQTLLAQGKSTQDIARLIKVDGYLEKLRAARAASQKNLEALITKEKSLAHSIPPLLENIQGAAAIETRLTWVTLSLMLLIHSFGERFTSVAQRILIELQIKTADDIEFSQGLQSIIGDQPSPEQTVERLVALVVRILQDTGAQLRSEFKGMRAPLQELLRSLETHRQISADDSRLVAAALQDLELNNLKSRNIDSQEYSKIFLPFVNSLLVYEKTCHQTTEIAKKIEAWYVLRGPSTLLHHCQPEVWQAFESQWLKPHKVA